MAKQKTNLPFLTCGNEDWRWGLDLVIDFHDAAKAAKLIEGNFHNTNFTSAKAVILSIFPHRGKPETLGVLLDALGKEGVDPVAMANSHSSVSVVLPEDATNKATNALFGPFSFSAYRSPADWKLTQKGKEELYKEVVASYQEKRPKVYGLEWEAGQELWQVKMNRDNLRTVGEIFKGLSRLDLPLTFLVTSPSKDDRATNLFFCVPESEKSRYNDTLKKPAAGAVVAKISSVAYFSMNGPHFGDRYGIANELLMALDGVRAELMGLSCSIASISGVVPADQIHSAIQAIRGCFEVPSVKERGRS